MSQDKRQQGSLWQRIGRNVRYCISGVWDDTRALWSVKTLKILNLSIRSFLDRDLQLRAGSLTSNTVLAIVPALAMLFAIARGFGFQNLVQSQLFRYFPAQQQALETALSYVDNYLSQASQGAFVGIGVIFLLWTLISLMSNVEDTFNHVWGVTSKRSFRRKLTDYTALFLMLPVLMVCSAGISIFMSDAVQRVFEFQGLSPMKQRLLSFTPTFISWIIFTAAYYLVPNTRVKFKGALLAGVLCGTVFQLVQWLFVSGQMYVSKYNAIYGSFAFLPLLLVWLQLSWLIALSGVVLTYALQNFDSFAYRDKAEDISQSYANSLAIAILAIATQRFKRHEAGLTRTELVRDYDIPFTMADALLKRLQRAGLLSAISSEGNEDVTYQPSCDPDELTLNLASNALVGLGNDRFIIKADNRLAAPLHRIAQQCQAQQQAVPDISLLELMKD